MLLRCKILIRQFLNDESGATAIEYALIAAGIAAALVATINTLGTNVAAMWTNMQTAIN